MERSTEPCLLSRSWAPGLADHQVAGAVEYKRLGRRSRMSNAECVPYRPLTVATGIHPRLGGTPCLHRQLVQPVRGGAITFAVRLVVIRVKDRLSIDTRW